MKYLMKKNLFPLILTLAMILSVFPVNAKTSTVSVSTPGFPVILNGFATSDDEYFPLLVYKNITYIPLTQKMAEHLNLWVHWDSESTSLHIKKNSMKNDFLSDFGTPSKNKVQFFKATKANYPIFVNGQKLNLSAEPYPVLNFRNITYFPLTWRFAVKEFGWQYHFSAKEGLNIRSLNYNPDLLPHEKRYNDTDSPKNLELSTIKELPAKKALKISSAAFKEPFYYKNGKIYYFTQGKNTIDFWRQALDGKPDKFGSADIADKNYIGYHYTTLFPNQEMIFSSHFGGATMGNSVHYLLPENGPATNFSDRRYSFLKSMDDGFVCSLSSVTGPMPGLHKIDLKGQHQDFGMSNKYYFNGLTQNNVLYALLSDDFQSHGKSYPLYAIDLKNGQHTELLTHVHSFILGKDKIYFKKEDGKEIYSFDIETGKEEKLISLFEKYQNYFSVGDDLFSTMTLDKSLGVQTLVNLYHHQSGKWQLLAKEVAKPVYSDSHLVYLQPTTKGNYIVITDSAGKILAKISVNHKEVDYFLNDDELIVWSWQDETVRYYEWN